MLTSFLGFSGEAINNVYLWAGAVVDSTYLHAVYAHHIASVLTVGQLFS